MGDSIVEREAWGARPPRSRVLVTWDRSVRLHLHHTATAAHPPGTPQRHVAGLVRAIQNHHMFTNGWSDIGYGWLVDEDGRVYVGRGIEVQGAHAPGRNDEPSVALIGDYRNRRPTRAQELAVQRLRRAHAPLFPLVAHSSVYPTECPGGMARAVLIDGSVSPRYSGPHRPHGATLRLYVAGHPGSPWGGDEDGWGDALGPLRAIARYGLEPEPPGDERHAIAWRGWVWRGAHDVYHVCRHLYWTHLGVRFPLIERSTPHA